mmetsp:Transcript_6496/g.16371  ORF Transcript_6496/g.16371 Transcript_6496/m.16371 type:complete len:296 (-) Transcript_6496:817-1704(-)
MRLRIANISARVLGGPSSAPASASSFIVFSALAAAATFFCTVRPFCGCCFGRGGGWEEKRKGISFSSANLAMASPAINMNSITRSLDVSRGISVMSTLPSSSTVTSASGNWNPAAPSPSLLSLNRMASLYIFESSSSPASIRSCASLYESLVAFTALLQISMSEIVASSPNLNPRLSVCDSSCIPTASLLVSSIGSIVTHPSGRYADAPLLRASRSSSLPTPTHAATSEMCTQIFPSSATLIASSGSMMFSGSMAKACMCVRSLRCSLRTVGDASVFSSSLIPHRSGQGLTSSSQ